MRLSPKQLMSTGACRFFLPYGLRDTLIRLIEAFSDAEDPVALLVASAQEHTPLNAVGRTRGPSHILDPENRQPIDRIIEELHGQGGYMQQTRHRRTFDAKAGSLGRCDENNLSSHLNKT